MGPADFAKVIEAVGWPIAVAAIFAAAIMVLFKRLDDSHSQHIKEIKEAHAEALKVLREALELEREQKDAAKSRLDSNNTALREATVAFNSAVGVMEKLAERDERPQARRRPTP